MIYRICRCYSPIVGTWYVVQKRYLFWWRDLPFAFMDVDMANQFIRVHEKTERICKTPLTYNATLDVFEEIYNIQKTDVVEVKI